MTVVDAAVAVVGVFRVGRLLCHGLVYYNIAVPGLLFAFFSCRQRLCG